MNDIKLNVELTIIWHKDMPIAFWFGNKLVWESDDIFTALDYPETKITLPFMAAIKLSSVFLQGMAADRLVVLLATLQMKIDEVRALRIEQQRVGKQVDDAVDAMKNKESEPELPDDEEWDDTEDENELN